MYIWKNKRYIMSWIMLLLFFYNNIKMFLVQIFVLIQNIFSVYCFALTGEQKWELLERYCDLCWYDLFSSTLTLEWSKHLRTSATKAAYDYRFLCHFILMYIHGYKVELELSISTTFLLPSQRSQWGINLGHS